MAAGAGVATPMGAQALALFKQYVESGEGGSDFSGIIRLMRSLAR